MTENQWLRCTDPSDMLQFVWTQQQSGIKSWIGCLFRGNWRKTKPISNRKVQYVLRACCRRYSQFFADERDKNALQMADMFVEGLVSEQELREASRGCSDGARYMAEACLNPELSSGPPDNFSTSHPAIAVTQFIYSICDSAVPERSLSQHSSLEWQSIRAAEQAAIANLIREVIGNLFHPVAIDPRWLTSTVVDLARAIYDEKAFDRMPILADALMDAGCDSEEIIAHCRRSGEHVRGCWVVDLLTGRK